jgi:APA family basic amino acid/polyamine antiporter
MKSSQDVPPALISQSGAVTQRSQLVRGLGLLGLISTALSAMVGVGVNILPFMVQRNEPGVAGTVPIAYVLAAVPAALAALCYAMLSSAMPRAGGSYVYATRALDPLVGFLASFAQWFGLSMGMGVVAYLLVPMIRDVVATAGWPGIAPVFDQGPLRVTIALGAIWAFWVSNRLGVQTYERTVVVLVAAMIVGPIIMTVVGFANTPADFERALAANGIAPPPAAALPSFSMSAFLATCVVLFSSFIGFDAIAQAGGEARSVKDLPRSIVISLVSVAVYYVLFTAAVYHAVPWSHIYRASLVQDISAPGLLAPLMPRWVALVLLLAVTSSVLNSIISVMLANSRMLYAFAADRLFPGALAAIHPRYRTPHHAITMTAVAGSLSVIGCHLARDFFLGVDLLILSMLMNFILMAVAVITLPRTNPALYHAIEFLRSRGTQVAIAVSAIVLLGALLLIQIVTDLTSPAPWYFKATGLWIVVMVTAALVFRWFWRALEREGVDPRAEIFSQLPPE